MLAFAAFVLAAGAQNARPVWAAPAKVALAARAPVFVAVTEPPSGGLAGLSGNLRGLVLADLQRIPEVTLDVRKRSGARKRFAVDGAITRLERGDNGDVVEMNCEVKITVSDPRGRILGIVTAGATAMRPRAKYNPTMDAAMQSEALEGAVEGVHGQLAGFLTRTDR